MKITTILNYLKILFELLILHFLLIIGETILWGVLVEIGNKVWGCSLYDTGIFHPPGIICDQTIPGSSIYTELLRFYSQYIIYLAFIVLIYTIGTPYVLLFYLFLAVVFTYLIEKKSPGIKIKFLAVSRFVIKKLKLMWLGSIFHSSKSPIL